MKKVLLTALTGLLLTSPMSAQNTYGLFNAQTGTGPSGNQESCVYNPSDQTYTIATGHHSNEDDHASFHYLWSTIQGDFILRAELCPKETSAHPDSELGWMIRNNLNTSGHQIRATLRGDGQASLQTGPPLADKAIEGSGYEVIQLERHGDTFTMSAARFGEEFRSVTITNTGIDPDAYLGLYLQPAHARSTDSVRFRNVRIIKPADPDFVPYQDYIGSNLEILDVASGHRTVISRSEHSIQAPNWTTDNRIIYNSKGLLFTLDPSTRGVEPLNTGFANNNNNDHVLSFDGALMGISHHNPDDQGHSAIYYLPVQGDTHPRKVTRDGVGPSYLHGWSPDGQSLLFTGERNSQYDIYSVNIHTGEEQQLTNQVTLDDGSEYSPDGRFIFFNSARSGRMKLWRMNADGSEQVQLTNDGYNDWFPHVSPDMKWIVFISFPKDIDPGDHPFYKHCLIRIMPFEGGEPRVVAYIYGGQGSLNVPSWSPDSKKIAFISNSAR